MNILSKIFYCIFKPPISIKMETALILMTHSLKSVNAK